VQTAERAEKSEKLFRGAGWTLIAVGFAIPQFQNMSLGDGAFSAGYDFARSFGQLMLPAFIAAFMTRGKSDLLKAKGTFVVGLVMVLTAGTMAVNKHSEMADTKVQLESALTFQAEQRAKLEAVSARLNAVDLNRHITLESMTDPSKRALALADISQYKALLSERKASVASSISATELRIAQLPEGDARRGGEEGLANAKAANQAVFGEIDVAQFEYADVLDQLFKLMESQDGKYQLDARGQILFQDPAALAQFQKLAANSDVKAARLNEAMARATVAQEKVVKRDAEMQLEAQKILGK
jgi:hypothetical protein